MKDKACCINDKALYNNARDFYIKDRAYCKKDRACYIKDKAYCSDDIACIKEDKPCCIIIGSIITDLLLLLAKMIFKWKLYFIFFER